MECSRVHEAQAGAQAKEPSATELLAENRARVEQAVVGGVAHALRLIAPRCRCLQLDDVDDVPWNCIGEDICDRAHTESRHLISGVGVETNGGLACHQVAEQIALRQRKIVRIPERQLRPPQGAGDIYLYPHIPPVRTLSTPL